MVAKPVEKEEYEIIPHQILSDLRDEIELLKEKLTKPEDEVGKELLVSMAEVKNTIHDFMEAIKIALKEIKTDEKGDAGAALKGMSKKIDQLAKQNEEIATALVSIVETLRRPPMAPPIRVAPPVPRVPPRMPAHSPMPPPPGRSPSMPPPPPPAPSGRPTPTAHLAPPPSGAPMPSEMPPPPGPHKKGLLGMFFKK
ncbi:hypothetical protein ACFLZB_00140 [Nanoarchaeota archaeon]